jgi:DNA excision repair protein ERCC-2
MSSKEKPVINIGVRTLVEFTMRSGDLDMTTFGTVNPIEGLRIHQEIQESRPAEYIPEVRVQTQQETPYCTLLVQGRVDGVFTYADRVIIEEIKTTKKDLKWYARHEDPLHWSQAKCYACMYAIDQSLDMIDVRITYYQVETGVLQEFTRTFTREELERFFNQLVLHYLVWAERMVRWLAERNHSIQALAFPFEVFRPGQEQIIDHVQATIRNDTQLYLQAPTGIGKTMAVIFGVLHMLPQQKIAKVFYLTARTTGRTAAETTFEILRDQGLRCKVLSLTAKEKVCFNPEKLCNGKECTYARGFYDRIQTARSEAFTCDDLTREKMSEIARRHHVCPFEFSLDMSLWVDCIICDYNYAFDPKVYLRRFFADGEGDYVFLVDEAHNLVDRSRDMFSAEIDKRAFIEVKQKIQHGLPGVNRAIDSVVKMLAEMERECEIAGNPRAEKEPPEDIYPGLIEFTRASEKWLGRNEFSAFRQSLLETYFDTKRFLWTAAQYSETYATCYYRSGNSMRVQLRCLDPAEHMQKALQRSQSTVFFSATLHPMSFFIESFGSEPDTSTLSLSSPFNSENLCVLIAHKISTLYKHRDFTRRDVARVVSASIDQHAGNYLIFFPSYEYLSVIHADFESRHKALTTLVQKTGMSERERDDFIDRFKRSEDGYLVGFAVMGGVFAESIDLLGEQLTGAVIIGVGMPGICLERELIKEYYDRKIGAGFAFAYQFPGIIKVLQAAGRVIRSEYDRGVLVLVDTRYARREYLDLLPDKWRIRFVRDHVEIIESLQRFWRH